MVFLDLFLENEISCDADHRGCCARPCAKEKILYGEKPLVECSEDQDRAMLFALKCHDARDNAEAADQLCDDIHWFHVFL